MKATSKDEDAPKAEESPTSFVAAGPPVAPKTEKRKETQAGRAVPVGAMADARHGNGNGESARPALWTPPPGERWLSDYRPSREPTPVLAGMGGDQPSAPSTPRFIRPDAEIAARRRAPAVHHPGRRGEASYTALHPPRAREPGAEAEDPGRRRSSTAIGPRSPRPPRPRPPWSRRAVPPVDSELRSREAALRARGRRSRGHRARARPVPRRPSRSSRRAHAALGSDRAGHAAAHAVLGAQRPADGAPPSRR